MVGIGASAGGLEAFSQLLSRLPAQCGVAFVVVQHLDPIHESLLGELLARKCRLRVVSLGKRVRVQRDRVYVVPPGRSLALAKGFLRTAILQRSSGGPSLIDHFFVSLANSRGRRAVGVLLSGSGHDGVAGLEAIQAAGGITLCQSPDSAHISGMPQAAVNARAADLVLDLPELADELVRIGRTLAGGAVIAEDGLAPVGGDGLAAVLTALRTRTGLDFSTYKPSTVRRRLARRMGFGKFDSIPSYVRHLLRDPREASDLAEDLLIHVTRFFRDPTVFTALQRGALPRLMRERGAHEPLRLWVPGCATGEEVYSLAISVLEYLGGTVPRPPIQIFGTDISELAIAKARAGLYSAKIRAEVPAELLRKYFTKVEGGYQVARQVRSLCAFARHDVTLDPPFSRLDLISCRNVLIYHTAEAQQRMLSMLHYALLPHGVLILGSSESIGAKPDLFAALAPRERIFVKKAARSHAAFGVAPAEPKRAHAAAAGNASESTAITLACKEADRVLLGKFTPAAVLVDRDLQIVQFRGQPGRFITPASGAASLSILKMVHPSLSPELHQALRPRKGAIKASSTTVAIDVDGRPLNVRMEVLPIHVSQSTSGHALVVFHPLPVQRLEKEPVGKGKARSVVERLKRELSTARDHLQTLLAEHQAANEALQTALESGQSANEELQSTNEELETAKEELQSTNEELSTVNDELQARNLDLNQLNNDLVHVLASIDMPIMTLGRDTRVRRFNGAAERVLNLLPGDLGRPLSELRVALPGFNLAELVGQLIKGGKPAEVEVLSREERPYVLHARPYPAGAAVIEGVIVTLVAGRLPAPAARAAAGKVTVPARAKAGAGRKQRT